MRTPGIVKVDYIESRDFFISFLMVLPVVWGNVLEGIRNTDTGLLEMAKVMGLGQKKTLFKI